MSGQGKGLRLVCKKEFSVGIEVGVSVGAEGGKVVGSVVGG